MPNTKYPHQTSNDLSFVDVDELPAYHVVIEWLDDCVWRPVTVFWSVVTFASMELAKEHVLFLQSELFSKREYRLVVHDDKQPLLPQFEGCRQVFDLPDTGEIDMMFKNRQWEFWSSL